MTSVSVRSRAHTRTRIGALTLAAYVAPLLWFSVEDHLYEEALYLTRLTPELSEEHRASKLTYVKTLYAFDLFVKGAYEQSLTMMYELRIDPPQVS